eukprot:INCI13158.1.p1 GENE.INCI13158.1~~INCI13158.1.p1  ORF type:complete len:410 (-),score=27.54 INCI13158.1:198-1427(-)
MRETQLGFCVLVLSAAACVVRTESLYATHSEGDVAFMRGAAMGMLPVFDCNGTCSQYKANKTAPAQDALQILSDYGLNTVRLRLFGPDTFANNSYAALPSVLAMARRARAANLSISLDIFYSQWYSGDDSTYLQRRAPPRWHNLTFAQLSTAAANYTFSAVQALVEQGSPPQSVQIGNEINCGLFYPWQGESCDTGAEVCSCKDNYERLAAIINASTRAAKRAWPSAEIIIQYAASQQLGNRDNFQTMFNFYAQLEKFAAQYDAIGVSFYQIWGASNVSNLCNLDKIAGAIPGKRIFVIETGYPYQAGGHAPQDMLPKPQCPLTPEGQEQWLRAVVYTVEHGLWGRGAGVSWWGTEYATSCSGDECAGFWDHNFVAHSVLTNRAFLNGDEVPAGAVVCPPLREHGQVGR